MRRAFGSSHGEVLEDLEDPISIPNKERRFKPQWENTGAQLARNLYVRFASIVQPSPGTGTKQLRPGIIKKAFVILQVVECGKTPTHTTGSVQLAWI